MRIPSETDLREMAEDRLVQPVAVEKHDPWQTRPRSLRDDRRFKLFLVEMDRLETTIAWYDEAVMRGKRTWLPLWGCLMAVALVAARPEVALVGLAAIAGFAVTELILRRYQRRYVVRAEELEELLATGNLNDYRYSVAQTAGRSSRGPEILYALIQPHFSLQYGCFALLSLGCAIYVAF
jgi:hypothetical protein